MKLVTVTVAAAVAAVCGCRRYVATELPLRYRKLATKTSRCYVIVVGLWTGALVTFIAPQIATTPNWTYYRYDVHYKMCGLHWDDPVFITMLVLYIPILSGAVLVFTGLRIRANLRQRPSVRLRLHQTTSQLPTNSDSQQSTGSRPVPLSDRADDRKTMKIIIFTSVAYFIFWTPHSVLGLAQSLCGSFTPPTGIMFAAVWLANANSAVNVFIYSYSNAQFRRQCVLLASRLCCSRLLCDLSMTQRPNTNRPDNLSVSPAAINLSTIVVPAPPRVADANPNTLLSCE